MPDAMPIAVLEALPQRNFQNATVPFVGRTDDAGCSGIAKARYWVRDKLHVAKSPDRLVDNGATRSINVMATPPPRNFT